MEYNALLEYWQFLKHDCYDCEDSTDDNILYYVLVGVQQISLIIRALICEQRYSDAKRCIGVCWGILNETAVSRKAISSDALKGVPRGRKWSWVEDIGVAHDGARDLSTFTQVVLLLRNGLGRLEEQLLEAVHDTAAAPPAKAARPSEDAALRDDDDRCAAAELGVEAPFAQGRALRLQPTERGVTSQEYSNPIPTLLRATGLKSGQLPPPPPLRFRGLDALGIHSGSKMTAQELSRHLLRCIPASVPSSSRSDVRPAPAGGSWLCSTTDRSSRPLQGSPQEPEPLSESGIATGRTTTTPVLEYGSYVRDPQPRLPVTDILSAASVLPSTFSLVTPWPSDVGKRDITDVGPPASAKHPHTKAAHGYRSDATPNAPRFDQGSTGGDITSPALNAPRIMSVPANGPAGPLPCSGKPPRASHKGGLSSAVRLPSPPAAAESPDVALRPTPSFAGAPAIEPPGSSSSFFLTTAAPAMPDDAATGSSSAAHHRAVGAQPSLLGLRTRGRGNPFDAWDTEKLDQWPAVGALELENGTQGRQPRRPISRKPSQLVRYAQEVSTALLCRVAKLRNENQQMLGRVVHQTHPRESAPALQHGSNGTTNLQSWPTQDTGMHSKSFDSPRLLTVATDDSEARSASAQAIQLELLGHEARVAVPRLIESGDREKLAAVEGDDKKNTNSDVREAWSWFGSDNTPPLAACGVLMDSTAQNDTRGADTVSEGGALRGIDQVVVTPQASRSAAELCRVSSDCFVDNGKERLPVSGAPALPHQPSEVRCTATHGSVGTSGATPTVAQSCDSLSTDVVVGHESSSISCTYTGHLDSLLATAPPHSLPADIKLVLSEIVEEMTTKKHKSRAHVEALRREVQRAFDEVSGQRGSDTNSRLGGKEWLRQSVRRGKALASTPLAASFHTKDCPLSFSGKETIRCGADTGQEVHQLMSEGRHGYGGPMPVGAQESKAMLGGSGRPTASKPSDCVAGSEPPSSKLPLWSAVPESAGSLKESRDNRQSSMLVSGSSRFNDYPQVYLAISGYSALGQQWPTTPSVASPHWTPTPALEPFAEMTFGDTAMTVANRRDKLTISSGVSPTKMAVSSNSAAAAHCHPESEGAGTGGRAMDKRMQSSSMTPLSPVTTRAASQLLRPVRTAPRPPFTTPAQAGEVSCEPLVPSSLADCLGCFDHQSAAADDCGRYCKGMASLGETEEGVRGQCSSATGGMRIVRLVFKGPAAVSDGCQRPNTPSPLDCDNERQGSSEMTGTCRTANGNELAALLEYCDAQVSAMKRVPINYVIEPHVHNQVLQRVIEARGNGVPTLSMSALMSDNSLALHDQAKDMSTLGPVTSHPLPVADSQSVKGTQLRSLQSTRSTDQLLDGSSSDCTSRRCSTDSQSSNSGEDPLSLLGTAGANRGSHRLGAAIESQEVDRVSRVSGGTCFKTSQLPASPLKTHLPNSPVFRSVVLNPPLSAPPVERDPPAFHAGVGASHVVDWLRSSPTSVPTSSRLNNISAAKVIEEGSPPASPWCSSGTSSKRLNTAPRLADSVTSFAAPPPLVIKPFAEYHRKRRLSASLSLTFFHEQRGSTGLECEAEAAQSHRESLCIESMSGFSTSPSITSANRKTGSRRAKMTSGGSVRSHPLSLSSSGLEPSVSVKRRLRHTAKGCGPKSVQYVALESDRQPRAAGPHDDAEAAEETGLDSGDADRGNIQRVSRAMFNQLMTSTTSSTNGQDHLSVSALAYEDRPGRSHDILATPAPAAHGDVVPDVGGACIDLTARNDLMTGGVGSRFTATRKKDGASVVPPAHIAEAPAPAPLVYPLSVLVRQRDWTKLSADALTTCLELCVGTLRIQRCTRHFLALKELQRRKEAVQKHLEGYHRQDEALVVLQHFFRMVLARRQVDWVRMRVRYVMEQRIELERYRENVQSAAARSPLHATSSRRPSRAPAVLTLHESGWNTSTSVFDGLSPHTSPTVSRSPVAMQGREEKRRNGSNFRSSIVAYPTSPMLRQSQSSYAGSIGGDPRGLVPYHGGVPRGSLSCFPDGMRVPLGGGDVGDLRRASAVGGANSLSALPQWARAPLDGAPGDDAAAERKISNSRGRVSQTVTPFVSDGMRRLSVACAQVQRTLSSPHCPRGAHGVGSAPHLGSSLRTEACGGQQKATGLPRSPRSTGGVSSAQALRSMGLSSLEHPYPLTRSGLYNIPRSLLAPEEAERREKLRAIQRSMACRILVKAIRRYSEMIFKRMSESAVNQLRQVHHWMFRSARLAARSRRSPQPVRKLGAESPRVAAMETINAILRAPQPQQAADAVGSEQVECPPAVLFFTSEDHKRRVHAHFEHRIQQRRLRGHWCTPLERYSVTNLEKMRQVRLAQEAQRRAEDAQLRQRQAFQARRPISMNAATLLIQRVARGFQARVRMHALREAWADRAGLDDQEGVDISQYSLNLVDSFSGLSPRRRRLPSPHPNSTNTEWDERMNANIGVVLRAPDAGALPAISPHLDPPSIPQWARVAQGGHRSKTATFASISHSQGGDITVPALLDTGSRFDLQPYMFSRSPSRHSDSIDSFSVVEPFTQSLPSPRLPGSGKEGAKGPIGGTVELQVAVPLEIHDAVLSLIRTRQPHLLKDVRETWKEQVRRGLLVVQAALLARKSRSLVEEVRKAQCARRIQLAWMAYQTRRGRAIGPRPANPLHR